MANGRENACVAGEPANEVLRGPVEKRKSEAGSAAFPAAPWLKQGLYSTAWCPEVESKHHTQGWLQDTPAQTLCFLVHTQHPAGPGPMCGEYGNKSIVWDSLVENLLSMEGCY